MIRLAKASLAIAYAVLKWLPARNKRIIFLSRQSNSSSLDFRMLQAALLHRDGDLEIVSICNRLDGTLRGNISFCLDIIRSLYYLATSSVCVLDSYWPTVSLLNHKKSLTVVQMWHSLGKIKQSGLQSVGRAGGRSRKLSEELRMHRNYDYIVAGSPVWNACYCASFGCAEEALLNIGLPRIDYIINEKEKNARLILKAYPRLFEKPIVLYAPTFRRGRDVGDVVADLVCDDYNLVLKCHPNQMIEGSGAFDCPEFTAMQFLSVADVLVTDYSAIALEGAVARVKTLYYLYDYDQYIEENGLNIDLPAEMPGCVFYDGPSIASAVRSALFETYPTEVFESYREKYLIHNEGNCTSDLAEFIISVCIEHRCCSQQMIIGVE